MLQTKKRYVGHMWETEGQSEAVFEAKGIETVRRDGCPFTVKVGCLAHFFQMLPKKPHFGLKRA